jgi:hypothetical protein
MFLVCISFAVEVHMKKANVIGVMWLNQNKKSTALFYGNYVDSSGKHVNFVVFTNRYKRTTKDPDYNIVESFVSAQESQTAVGYE